MNAGYVWLGVLLARVLSEAEARKESNTLALPRKRFVGRVLSRVAARRGAGYFEDSPNDRNAIRGSAVVSPDRSLWSPLRVRFESQALSSQAGEASLQQLDGPTAFPFGESGTNRGRSS